MRMTGERFRPGRRIQVAATASQRMAPSQEKAQAAMLRRQQEAQSAAQRRMPRNYNDREE